LVAKDCHQIELARFGSRKDDRFEHHLDIACQQIGHCISVAAIGHMYEAHSGEFCKKGAPQM